MKTNNAFRGLLSDLGKQKDWPEKLSKMRQSPCRDYYESDSRPGYCGECGHPENAHKEQSEKENRMKNNRPKVITSGEVSRIASADSLMDSLKAGFYVLEMNMQGFYLTRAESFAMPKKVYGNAHERAQRILKTYTGRGDKSMGVMCSGRPGTGKTILSKLTANMAHEMGMPIIIVRQGYFGPPMSAFLESLPNKCLMFIDEIEKVYDSTEARHWLLSVLDGTVNSSHLWLATCNDPHIGEAFESRPGRIRYHYRFQDMDDEVVQGMINEAIKSKTMRKAVIEMASKIHNLTPDMLCAIIEECLIHNELPSSFIEFLNVDTSIPDSFSMKGFIHSYRMTAKNEAIIEQMLASGSDDEKRFANYATRNGLVSALDNYGYHHATRLEKSLVEISSYWIRDPISFDNANRIELEMRLEVNKTNIAVNWSADEIKRTEFKNGSITIYGPGKGEVVYLKPTRFGREKGIMAL
jgi:DNA replication protein DnaC